MNKIKEAIEEAAQAVDAATSADETLAALGRAEAAHYATRGWSDERLASTFLVLGAESKHRAALRTEKIPRVICEHCQRKLKAKEPLVGRFGRVQFSNRLVCLRCDRREHKEHQRYVANPRSHAQRLQRLDQQACPTCERTIYVEGYTSRVLTCSYQCPYRRKIKRQLERKRVEHETIACIVCNEMFTQRRKDA
jgi:hypothetical protein